MKLAIIYAMRLIKASLLISPLTASNLTSLISRIIRSYISMN